MTSFEKVIAYPMTFAWTILAFAAWVRIQDSGFSWISALAFSLVAAFMWAAPLSQKRPILICYRGLLWLSACACFGWMVVTTPWWLGFFV